MYNEDTVVFESLPVTLTDADTLVHSRELARLNSEAVKLENQKKEVMAQFAADAKRIASQMNSHSVAINNGYEHREVKCYWKFDWEHGKKTLIRTDTLETVRIVDVTPAERQGKLDEEAKKKGGAKTYVLDGGKKMEPKPEDDKDKLDEKEKPGEEVNTTGVGDTSGMVLGICPTCKNGDPLKKEGSELTIWGCEHPQGRIENVDNECLNYEINEAAAEALDKALTGRSATEDPDCAPERNDKGDCQRVWTCETAVKQGFGCCRPCDKPDCLAKCSIVIKEKADA